MMYCRRHPSKKDPEVTLKRRQEPELIGQVVIVTGASRGLGAAIARDFAMAGAHVVIMARDPEQIETAAAAIRADVPDEHQEIIPIAGNVANPIDVEKLFNAAGAVGGAGILVCNAGIHGPIGRVDEVPWDTWMSAIETNLYGVVLCCRLAVADMRDRHRGKIVVLSGGGATSPMPGFSAYAASKAGVVRFVETLAREVADDGIEVNAVAPGIMDTALLNEAIDAGPEVVGQDYYERIIAEKRRGATPLSRGVELVRFLSSAGSDGISGRLISAVWDPWSELSSMRDRLMASDVYTLRRIVPEDRGWV